MLEEDERMDETRPASPAADDSREQRPEDPELRRPYRKPKLEKVGRLRAQLLPPSPPSPNPFTPPSSRSLGP